MKWLEIKGIQRIFQETIPKTKKKNNSLNMNKTKMVILHNKEQPLSMKSMMEIIQHLLLKNIMKMRMLLQKMKGN